MSQSHKNEYIYIGVNTHYIKIRPPYTVKLATGVVATTCFQAHPLDWNHVQGDGNTPYDVVHCQRPTKDNNHWYYKYTSSYSD